MWFPHIAIDLVFVLDMVILHFLAIRFRWYAIVCRSSSDVAITNVKEQIFHGLSSITCSTNCKYRTAATLYTPETWFVSSI